MKLIKRLPECDGTPLTFKIDLFNESSAYDLLRRVIENARQVIGAVSDLYKWTNNPSLNVRAVFGHWIVKAMRHFCAITILCEERDLSVVANVHYRQIFEIYLQIRYYSSLSEEVKEKYAEKIMALGCLEYLEKMGVLKDHDHFKQSYEEISKKLAMYDKELVTEIENNRKKNKYSWFDNSFSKLAKNICREGEDLESAYHMLSADMHGVWDLILDVDNPAPGVLDFRGYPNKTILYIRAAEMLDQVTSLIMKLWNEVADSVGAQGVFYQENPNDN